MLPFAVGGTALWLVLGVVFAFMRSTLAAHGHESWISISFTGAALGVVGILVMAVHDRNRARRKIADEGASQS
jgi:hypothetical protein